MARCKSHVAGHAPVGAGRERQGDFGAVGNAIALVLGLAESAKECLVRLCDCLVGTGPLESDASEREQLIGVRPIRKGMEKEVGQRVSNA